MGGTMPPTLWGVHPVGNFAGAQCKAPSCPLRLTSGPWPLSSQNAILARPPPAPR